MTETITIDGKDYEVLTLDRIGEITHDRLAGGKVVDAQYQTEFCLGVTVASPEPDTQPTTLAESELESFGIQPLKLIERVPVEFEAWTAIVNFHGNDVVAIICPETVHIDTKFQCVAVNK